MTQLEKLDPDLVDLLSSSRWPTFLMKHLNGVDFYALLLCFLSFLGLQSNRCTKTLQNEKFLKYHMKNDHEYFLHQLAQMFLLFPANDGGGKNSIQTS